MNKILKFVATMCLATLFLSACVYAAKLDTEVEELLDKYIDKANIIYTEVISRL